MTNLSGIKERLSSSQINRTNKTKGREISSLPMKSKAQATLKLRRASINYADLPQLPNELEPLSFDFLTQENPSALLSEVQSLLTSQDINWVAEGRNSEEISCMKFNLSFKIVFEKVSFAEGFYACKIKYPKTIKPEDTDLIRTMEIGIQNLLAS